MKKILQLLLLVHFIATNAQTPIYQFTFDNTLQDITNTYTCIKNPGVLASANPSYVAGESSGSYALAVSGTYNVQVNLPNIPQGNAPRTIMMRVQSFPTGSATNPLWAYGNTGALQKLSLTHDNNGSSNLMTDTVSTSTIATNCGINSLSSSWYLVTVTYDGTTMKIYRDSRFLASETVALATSGTLLKIGQFLESTSTVSGVGFKVDDLKIFDTALTLSQINAIYSNGTDLNNGLMAFYDFENNLDSSTGNHNLTPQGTMSYVTGIEGGTSKAGNFTGSNAAYTTSLDAVFNTQQYTIAFWEYRVSSAIISAYDTTYEAFGSQYFRVRSGIPRVSGAYNATNYFTEVNLNTNVGVWKHYAIVFKKLASSSVISIYEDGVFVSSTVVTNPVDLYKFNNKFTIGGGTDSSGNFLANKYAHANVDKFFIYNRALNEKEINLIKDQSQNALLSNDGFTSSATPRVNLYPNPVKNILNIEMNGALKSVEIFDVQGHKVLSSIYKQINMENLKSGIYLVKVLDDNNMIKTQKIVKD